MTEIFHNKREFPYEEIMDYMLGEGKLVDTGHWQAVKDVPNTRTVELQNVIIQVPIQATAGSWASFCQPNLPWAEDHFQERVAGEPTNPGKEYKNWPWFKPEWDAQDFEERFSHTYQERFWPKFAGEFYGDCIDDETRESEIRPCPAYGIRYDYGDLNDVLDLLRREPHTRQAYLPIFFPEDTGAHHRERIPCTLGYHFMLREDRLHCFYPMRSVDLVRYLRDDAYMAGRLVQWIIERLEDRKYPLWDEALPGNLTMFASSLHVFEDEIPALRRKHGATNA